MTAKQQSIKAAYGRYWDEVKKHVDINGWTRMGVMGPPEGMFIETNDDFHAWRPLALKGIESNNGWHRIDGPDDLPKVAGKYLFRANSGLNEKAYYNGHPETRGFFANIYTHWRPVEEIPEPVY